MSDVLDTDAIIAALGAPPRAFPKEATQNLPRVAGKTLPSVFAALFGALLLGVTVIQVITGEGDGSVMPGAAGVLLIGAAAFLIRMRNRIRATCIDVLAHGRATVGIVTSLQVRRMGGTMREDYEFGYADALGTRHVLKAFWTDPPMRAPQGTSVVVLHDPADPSRATVVPLDYPDLRLKSPEGARPRSSDEDMIATLARLGVPLNFSQSTPTAALLGGVIKAGLYNGVRKMEAGQLDDAMASFDAVISTAQRDPGFAKVQAAVHEQRGLAQERKGDAAAARADFDEALRLDPNRSEAAAALKRLV